jgi:hypothetical protein
VRWAVQGAALLGVSVSARVADSVAAMKAPVLAREYPAPATPVQRKIQASLHNPGSTLGSDEGQTRP